MIDVWKEILEPNVNIYVWIFILTCWFMLIKLEIDSDYFKLKISIIYFLFYIFALFKVVDIKMIILILFLSTFILIEFIFIDKFQRKILKKPLFYFMDYFYKIVFEYKVIYILFSFLLVSNTLKILAKKIFLITKINIVFSINYSSIYFFVTTFVSIVILLRGIIRCINNEFETYKFEEIMNKINTIKPFSQFYVDNRLKKFSNMLIFCEDKSYFYRKDTYNWFSLEFIHYRIMRMREYCTGLKVWKIKCLRELIFISYLVIKIIKLVIKGMSNIFTIIYKVIIRRKNIKYYLRGYSTIEMQLIRTLAVKDGYSTHIYQRKAYEFIYSKVFFSSLKNFYIYHHYSNIGVYKYYLIYLYISTAPINIYKRRYRNIFELYNTKYLKDISNEQFYIWIYSLSHYKITKKIYDKNNIQLYYLNKEKLEKTLDKIKNDNITNKNKKSYLYN